MAKVFHVGRALTLRFYRLVAQIGVFAVALPICAAYPSGSPAAASNLSLAEGAVIQADWQEPLDLPPWYRNHCRYDPFHRRPYCSNHCGLDYQFFYCSHESFGCCRLGQGYCDWRGHLRCAP